MAYIQAGIPTKRVGMPTPMPIPKAILSLVLKPPPPPPWPDESEEVAGTGPVFVDAEGDPLLEVPVALGGEISPPLLGDEVVCGESEARK